MMARQQRRHLEREIRKDGHFAETMFCKQCDDSTVMGLAAKGMMGPVLYTVMYTCPKEHHQAMFRGKYGPTDKG